MKPCALYRHLSADGVCLYIGISGEISARSSSHLRRSSWAQQIATITVKWFDTREEALAEEARAVMAEKPPFNKQLVSPRTYPRKSFSGEAPEADLVAEIEAHCARVDISVSEFGESAINDPNLVQNLRCGRELRKRTRSAIRAALTPDDPAGGLHGDLR